MVDIVYAIRAASVWATRLSNSCLGLEGEGPEEGPGEEGMQRGNTNTTRFKAGLAQRAKPSPITKARLQLSDATGPLCIASVPIRERRKYLTDRICALAIPGLG